MTPILALTAAIAMALVVFRAATQAISIDEATTYVLFVQNDMPFHWIGSTNNHVLNTALMRLTTRLFGVSELSARLPALLGAAIYIAASFRFCRLVGTGWILQWVTLICLIFSPFVMDYLVAARGYGLALGFLMTALLSNPKKLSGCVLASTMVGLCFASNFSFAFVGAAALGILFATSWRESGITKGRLIAGYMLPALIVVWVIAVPSIVDFPRAELTYGAHSLAQSFGSVLVTQAGIASPWVYLVPALLLIIGFRRPLTPLTMLFGSAFLVTAALHVAAFHLFGLLYPLDRTGIFYVPLAVGAVASMNGSRAMALILIAVLSLASLRLDHFEEWPFDADTDKVYAVAACLHDRHNVERFAAGWPHVAALNFYRGTTFPYVVDDVKGNSETQAFVIDSTLNPTVIADHQLTAIWRSKRTNATIAVPRPERFQGSACLE